MMPRAVSLVRIVFAALVALAVAASVAEGQTGLRRDTLVLETASGRHTFQIEIAETRQTQSAGMMFRRSLAKRSGMLFLYQEPQAVTMWMRNTYIPLDMVFIEADGNVLRIERNTEPFSERVIDSGGKVLAVLEINGGTAEKIGLKPGDRVVYKAFSATPENKVNP